MIAEVRRLLAIYLEGITIGSVTFNAGHNVFICSGLEPITITPHSSRPNLTFLPVGALSVENSEERAGLPDRRPTVSIALPRDYPQVASFRNDLGHPPVQLLRIRRSDPTQAWQFRNRYYEGHISSLSYEENVIKFEIESFLGDLDRIQGRYLTHQSQIERDPTDKALEFLEAIRSGVPSGFPFSFRTEEPIQLPNPTSSGSGPTPSGRGGVGGYTPFFR